MVVREKGLRVPDDLSLIGFDDIPIETTSPRVTLPAELVVRHSTTRKTGQP